MGLLKISILKPACLIASGLFYLFLPLQLFAQEEFSLETVESELVYQLDQFREAKGLAAMIRSEQLDAIAFDQAEYVAEKGRVIHEQEKEQKKTLLDRILYYEALNAEAGENIAIIAPQSKAQIEQGGERISIINEEYLVKAAFFNWMEEEDSRLNLLDPNFYEYGIGIHETERKEIVVVVVIASAAYQLPDKVKQKFNFRGISPYKEDACKEFNEKFGTTSVLFSDAFLVEEGNLYFQYHSKKLIEDLLSSSDDAISAEIILREQFSCGSSNRLFPGEVTNGYMMPLLKRSSMLNLNLAENDKAVKLLIGEIPEAFLSKDFEINGILISENTKCASVPYNKLQVKNLRWLDLPYQLVRSGVDSLNSWRDSLQLDFYADDLSALEAEWKEYASRLAALGLKMEKVSYEQFLSPSITHSFFSGYSEKLNQLMGLDSIQLGADTNRSTISWEAFDAFKKNTYYEIETQGMDRKAQEQYIAEHKDSDQELKAFVEKNTFLRANIIATINLKEERNTEELIGLFRFARQQNKPNLELYFLNRLIEGESASLETLLSEKERLEQDKEDLPLINNLIYAAIQEDKLIFDGNPMSVAFMELHLIDRSIPMIRYNYLVASLEDWAKKRSKPSSVKDWEDSFSKLRSFIDQDLYAKVILNFKMIMADHYYDLHDSKERADAFKEIMNWLPKADLSMDQQFEMAQYLAFQDQSNLAIRSLLPLIKEEDPPAKHLFYFLQLAVYNSDLVPNSLYLSSLKKAKERYPKDFCNFFSKEKMGIQPLLDYDIKALYCEQCEN